MGFAALFPSQVNIKIRLVLTTTFETWAEKFEIATPLLGKKKELFVYQTQVYNVSKLWRIIFKVTTSNLIGGRCLSMAYEV